MAKSLEEILGMIQDPEAKSTLSQTISSFNEKAQRLSALEGQLQNSELVDRSIANGWRKFDAEEKPAIKAQMEMLRTEVARLRPEAEAAALLRKQAADEGRTVTDPKDLIPSLRTEFISAADRQAIINEAVKQASERVGQAVNFGSIPMLGSIVEAKINAKQQFGLDLPIETIGEAVTRFGSVDKAYSALTHDAEVAKVAADRKAQAELHAAEVAKAREEGMRMGRQEADTRAYSPEEGGMSGVSPMVPPQDNKELQGVNPQSYNPSDGSLAREAAAKLAKQEADGLWGGGQRVM